MKNLSLTLLAIAFCTLIQAQGISLLENSSGCEASYQQGLKDAKSVTPFGWGAGGFGVGCLTGGCGSSLFPILVMNSDVEIESYPSGVNQECYKHGYQKKLIQRRVIASSVGSAVGILCAAVAYYAVVLSL